MYDAKCHARLGSPVDPIFIDQGICGDPLVYTKRSPGGRDIETDEERRAYEEWMRAKDRPRPLPEPG